MSQTVPLHEAADGGPVTGPSAGARPTPGAEERAARRRALLLGVALAAPSLLVVGGFRAAWPFLIVPMVLAGPLCGRRGLVAAIAVAAAVIALATGAEGAPVDDMAFGLAAFVATALLAGAMWEIHTRKLRRVAAQSVTDRLTGLRNYAYLEDALRRECRRVERYGGAMSLVLLDLDRFKELNDRHGHETGNRLLAQVGRTISEQVRASDVAARFGGEEFAILVPGGASEAAEAAERVRQAIGEQRIASGGSLIGATASGGVAELGPGEDVRSLIRRADAALYTSKRAGRDRVTVAPRPEAIAA